MMQQESQKRKKKEEKKLEFDASKVFTPEPAQDLTKLDEEVAQEIASYKAKKGQGGDRHTEEEF